MSVKIRLQRHGRKKQPYYHIVVADSRAPRDGKFIERIGSYNPNTNPATIQLDGDKALSWVENGAQPTDTCRAILSYKGVMYRKHLNRGVRKGSFSQEEADNKFSQWLESKAGKIDQKITSLQSQLEKQAQERKDRELEVSSKRAAEISARRNAQNAPAEPAEAEEGTSEETSTENNEG